MRDDPEYRLCRAISTYINNQFPKVLYHFDPTGNNLSKAAAGKLKAIQGGRAWLDLFIAEPRGTYHGLFLEIKLENARLLKRDGTWASTHLAEQDEMIERLKERGYAATFACGFEDAKKLIDAYLDM